MGDLSCPPQAEIFEDFGNNVSRKYILESIQEDVFSAKLPQNPPKFPPAAPHLQILKSLVLDRKSLKGRAHSLPRPSAEHETMQTCDIFGYV